MPIGVTPAVRKNSLPAARIRFVRAVSIGVAVCAAATAAYRLLAPYAAPPLAHRALERLAGSTGEWTARAERIHYEPFALAFDLERVHISGHDGRVVAQSALVRVDFSVRSLISARPVLDRLDIRGGALEGATDAASAMWSLLETIAADAQVASLTAEAIVSPVARPDSSQAVAAFELRGTGVDFGIGRGALELVAGNALGTGSRLVARFTAEPADAGALLDGRVSLTGAQIALGHWMITAPSAELSLEAMLSPSALAGSLSSLDGTIVATDSELSDARFELTSGSARGRYERGLGWREAEASASLAHGGGASVALTREGGWRLNAHSSAVPVMTLAPYAARAFGAELAGGIIDLELSIEPDARHARVTARAIRVASEQPLVATAIAVLEAPNDEISLNIPLSTSARVTEQIVRHIGEQVAAAGMAPFETLAALVGHDAADISMIEFVPGTAELTPRGQNAIAALAEALNLRQHVGVRLEVHAAAAVDRAALARAQVVLHVALATAQAARSARATEIDFASERAQTVLDEFARERLAPGVVEEIGASFAFGSASPSAPERVAYYRSVFEALVDREPIPDSGLRRLAAFRARAIEHRLGDMGIANSRVIDARRTAPVLADRVMVFLPLTFGAATEAESRLP